MNRWRALTWAGALIGGYLVLVHFKGFAADTGAAGRSSVNLVKAFQGR